MRDIVASRSLAIVAACLVAVFLSCFGDVLLLGRALAFRDTAHYYFPQFCLIADEIAAGRLPFWNHFSTRAFPCWRRATRR
ncbi:MAG: hypothetical protein R3C10_27960 [Pirellulales bacterium]